MCGSEPGFFYRGRTRFFLEGRIRIRFFFLAVRIRFRFFFSRRSDPNPVSYRREKPIQIRNPDNQKLFIPLTFTYSNNIGTFYLFIYFLGPKIFVMLLIALVQFSEYILEKQSHTLHK